MPYTSPFFSTTTGYSGEQSLVDDLVREQIKLYGIDLYYMPRRNLNMDKLLHESPKAAFELAMPIPMYLKSFSGYENGMEVLSKFGVRNADELTMVISRSEFITYYAPYIQSYYNGIKGLPPNTPLDPLEGETSARPKEGDLIYFPYDDGIFEIRYVNFDQPFFQLGQGYIFELQCEKFEYSGETFSTGIDQIDDSGDTPAYFKLEFTLDSGINTFEKFESVKIYDVSTPVADADTLDFRLYKDPGFLGAVPVVTARVVDWDKPAKKLILGDLSDTDPDQLEHDDNNYNTGDVDRNKFDSVMIVGDISGAVWYSVKAQTAQGPFDSSDIIQDEFEEIKILDVADDNPFGFI